MILTNSKDDDIIIIMNSITISKSTLAILKNFSSLNSNILVKPGNVLRTITVAKTGYAEAKVSETFDREFGIFDLTKFLGVVSVCTNPTFEFGDKSVNIHSSNGSLIEYYYSEPRLLTVPTKNVSMPKVTGTTNISQEIFEEINRISSVLQVEDLSFVTTDDGIVARVSDINDPSGNSYEINLGGEPNGHSFELNFKIPNLRILPGNYKVSFSEARMAVFQNENIDLTYWFGSESSSTYDE